MPPSDLLTFTRLFKEQGFGQRQTNRHLVDKGMDALVDRIGLEKKPHVVYSNYIRTSLETVKEEEEMFLVVYSPLHSTH